MAEIRDELVLVDRFTNIFSRFIDLGSRAARQAADTQNGAEKMAASATAAANTMGGGTTATYKWTEAAGSGQQQVTDESIRDTLMDLANYAIMTILEMEVDEDEGEVLYADGVPAMRLKDAIH